MSRRDRFVLLIAAGLASGQCLAAADAVRGEGLYEGRCGACHSIEANRVGPMHRGLFGRKAGAIEGFPYSAAVRKSKVVWNEQTLDRWLANPEAFIPGQRMGYQVPDATDRADVIAYLRKASAP